MGEGLSEEEVEGIETMFNYMETALSKAKVAFEDEFIPSFEW